MQIPLPAIAAITLPSLLAACASVPDAPASPQEAYWNALSSHCGKAYAGSLAT